MFDHYLKTEVVSGSQVGTEHLASDSIDQFWAEHRKALSHYDRTEKTSTGPALLVVTEHLVVDLEVVAWFECQRVLFRLERALGFEQ